MLHALESLGVSSGDKEYIMKSVAPVLENLTKQILKQRPADVSAFICEYLSEGKSEYKPKAPSVGDSPTSEGLGSDVISDNASDVSDVPVVVRASQRAAVSAEAYGKWNSRPANFVAPVHEKCDADKETISYILRSSFVFRGLSEEDIQKLVDAVEPMNVKQGTEIVKQGDSDPERTSHMYIVGSGVFECKKNGILVKSCLTGDHFGELALLYNTKRAATVTCAESGWLYRLDRQTFTFLVRDAMTDKRDRHVSFLKAVPILNRLGEYEIGQVADAISERTYRHGESIVCQGQKGSEFFILELGSLTASKDGHEVLTYSRAGEYFGELALLMDQARAATVTVTSPIAKVLVIDRAAFKRLLGPLQDMLTEHATSTYRLSSTLKVPK